MLECFNTFTMKSINITLEKRPPQSQSQREIQLKVTPVNVSDILEWADPDLHVTLHGRTLSVLSCTRAMINLLAAQLQEIPVFPTLCFLCFHMRETSRYCMAKKTRLKATRAAGPHHSWDKLGSSSLAKRRLFRLERISWWHETIPNFPAKLASWVKLQGISSQVTTTSSCSLQAH